MANKGYLIIEGAKAYCSRSATNNSKETAVPMEVKSQKEKLSKNKYFAQEKPIATHLDNKAESFGGGNGFGNCIGADGKTYPCKAKCKIKFKDYYENVALNKSMKILLDVSTGSCPGYKAPGTIAFATTGQVKNVSQIDVKNADEFSIANTSPQWPSSSASAATTSVNSVSMTLPFVAEKPSGSYYYIQSSKSLYNPWLNLREVDNLSLIAQFKGDASKIVWALFKGDGVKDKIKTFIDLGGMFNQSMSSLFEGLDEGKYRIEAYGVEPGDEKCTVHIEVVKDYVKEIISPGDSTLVNVPFPISITPKLSSITDRMRILNHAAFQPVLNAVHWRIKQEKAVLYNSFTETAAAHLVEVNKQGAKVVLTFKNAGKYTVEAFTDPSDSKPESITLKIESTLSVLGVQGEPSLLRFSDVLNVRASKFNVNYLPAQNPVYWYLKKEGKGRLTLFEGSDVFKTVAINKIVANMLYDDASLPSTAYFGSYILEGYAKPLGLLKEPKFTGADCFRFEVIRNVIDQFNLPLTRVPKGTTLKYTTLARITPLLGNEAIKIDVPDKVTHHQDGTLTFNALGEYTLSAYLIGDHTEPKKIEAKVNVLASVVKRALWAYKTGIKRAETGYEEETYGFLEIDGLQNQALKVKIWVKGKDSDFYKEKDKYLLEEKNVTLNSEGKTSFRITTNDDYKKKILAAIPKTTDNPNPQYSLIFTIEPQPNSSPDIVLPVDMPIEGTRSIKVDEKTTYLEVLDANEELVITTEQKIVSIMFSTEDGKDILRTPAFYGKTYKIWVHTVNMTEELLKVDVLKEIPKEGMNETDHIIYTHESKQSYKEEKPGKDGLLEVSFTVNVDWNKPAKNFDYYVAQVSRQVQDATDLNKKVWKIEKSQFTLNETLPTELVRTEDMEKLGIKAHKKDGTPFTKDEMQELRKRFIFYESGCLKVSQNVAPEAIENDVMPVMVEIAEVRKEKTCYCNRGFTEEEMEDLIKTMTGGNKIWQGMQESCDITDKTIKSLTAELNAMFSQYGMNRCMQKISFLANVAEETGFFAQSKEEKSKFLSSQSKYKGRGILQITGDKNLSTGYYEYPGLYKTYGKNRFDDENKFIGESSADLISTNLKYAVDVGGWVFQQKRAGTWDTPWTGKFAQYNSLRVEKQNYFKKGLGKNLIELGLLMEEEEEKYFWLQAKMLNGYSPKHRLDKNPNGWENRKKALVKLKTWFKYDKSVCDGDSVLLNLDGRAPWMKLVWEEEAKNLKETGFNEEIQKYFDGTPYEKSMRANTTNEEDVAWCAAFVNWIMKHYGYQGLETKDEYDVVRALKWAKWSEGRNIGKPVYGALAVKRRKGGGHIGFVAGKKGNKVIILGGNQSHKLQCTSYEISDYFAYLVPKNYEVTESDYNLPEYKGNPGAKSSEF
ncbi:TIGR02594 family protein [Pedobacter sp. MW01-1-1]|uniref:TIGR02594 family protein n=1 Tax=Pedobacter sp. MW01-1-1 TaxID=3383027 RepID=UPI003FF154C4